MMSAILISIVKTLYATTSQNSDNVEDEEVMCYDSIICLPYMDRPHFFLRTLDVIMTSFSTMTSYHDTITPL